MESGVTLFEEDMSGNITEITGPTTSQVTSGDLSVTQGRYYYGNGPVSFYNQATQSTISPLSLAGNLFWTYVSRYPPITMYVFSPHADADIEVYLDGSGMDGTPSQTLSVQEKSVGQTITLPTKGDYFFKSSAPIILTRRGSRDRSIVKPMEINEYIYTRKTEHQKTTINTTPSNHSGNFVKDDTYPCMTQAVADGSGGDMEIGLAYKNLSDTYIIPDGIASYYIVAPNTNTVYVEYWNGSSWTLHDTHTFNGTLSNPDNIAVGDQDGSDSAIAGTSNGPWRFRGNDLFYVLVNDLSNDEECLLGYTRAKDDSKDSVSKVSSKLRTANIIKDIKRDKNFIPTNHSSIVLRQNEFNYVDLNDVDSIIVIPHDNSLLLTNNFATECWFNFENLTENSINNSYPTIFSKSSQNYRVYYDISSDRLVARFNTGDVVITNASSYINLNEWHHIVVQKSSSGVQVYLDAILAAEDLSLTGDISTNTQNFVLGDWDEHKTNRKRTFEGKIGSFKIYNTIFDHNDVIRVYSALKQRYDKYS